MRWRRRMVRPMGLTLAVLLVAGGAAFHILSGLVVDQTRDDAGAFLSQAEATIDDWLDRYRALPRLYARDPRIVSAMAGNPRPGALDDLSRELAQWNGIAGTSDTYVMAADGTTVAASNWDTDISFVGRNFGFRPYFRDAMEGENGRFFGLGTTSGLRGYYLSAPIRQGEVIVGVIVVKVSVPALEGVLAEGPHAIFISDDAGVVILSTLPELRLAALRPIPKDRQTLIDRTRRYDVARIEPAPLSDVGGSGAGWPLVSAPVQGSPDARRTYLHTERALTGETWRLHLLYDVGAVRQQLWTIGVAIVAAAVAIAALAALAVQRRERLIQRLADRERDRLRLEHRVALRTVALSEANARLEVEVEERRATEQTLRQTQNELVQAGKLAALGQMSAALSHEFNQPLTAIRTYSENAAAFYEAGRADRAAENIGRVLRLTEKMAQLSKRLTRFARRSGDDVRPVDLDQVLSEALALVAARVERSEAEIAVMGDRGLLVQGGATRLMHVAMNLIGNALDAVPPDRPPRIAIHLAARDGQVAIEVTDNGTGIPEDALPHIFDPFFTTKEVGRGLGLGLSICYNIVRDFGGTMEARNRPEGGAAFTVTLEAAERLPVAAE